MSVQKFNYQVKIPEEIPANGQDWANYIGHFWNANEQIQIVLEFEEELNIDCLKRAVRLSIDVEPILGCKFAQDKCRPYWKRMNNIDEVDWCTFENVQDKEESLKRILAQPFDCEEYQLKVMVIRSKKSDTLCIKLNHACCDGGGAKDYLHLLSNIYTRLCDDVSCLPELNIAGKRDASRLFQVLNVSDPKMLINPQMATLKPTWAFPYKREETEKFSFSVSRLDQNQTSLLHSFTREKGVTINDLILTAFYRTMFIMVQPEDGDPMEICVTVDLRRYLPEKKADAICNLSGVINHRIAKKEGESNISTLKRVSLVMKEIKNNNPGLHSAASMEIMAGMEYEKAVAFIKNAWEDSAKSGKSTINLSNMGIVADYPLKFGSAMVEEAYIVTPVFKSPSFMLGVSSYNDTLTFTSGYCEPEIDKDDVETFFLILQKELRAFIE